MITEKIIKTNHDNPVFQIKNDRIIINAEIIENGPDLLINLSGGNAHNGCIVLALPGQMAKILELSHHKDAVVAAPMAETCANALGCNVAVCAGIHYPEISQSEIAEIMAICKILTDAIIKNFKPGNN